MTINEISNKIAKLTGFKKKDAMKFYNSFVAVLTNECYNAKGKGKGDTVSLPKIGRFTITYQNEHTSTSPLTGKPVVISARKRTSFKTYPSFKQAINAKPVKKEKATEAKTTKKNTSESKTIKAVNSVKKVTSKKSK